MLSKFLCALIAAQAIFSTAMADSTGTIQVLQPFSIVRTRATNETSPIYVEEFTLTKGVHNFEVSNFSGYDHTPCIPLFCGDSSTEVYGMELSLLANKKTYGSFDRTAVVDFTAAGTPSFNHNSSIYSAQQLGQSFNMIFSSSESTKKVNYRSEEQECSVEAFCRDSGYGGCYSAMGQQTINEHDEVTTTSEIVRFTDSSNSLLATFKGTKDSTETVTDTAGKCRLNFPQQR